MTCHGNIRTIKAELRLRLEQQELVAGFARFTLRTEALQPVLDEACRVAVEGARCEYAAVLEHRQATNEFLMRAGVGWHHGLVGGIVQERFAVPASTHSVDVLISTLRCRFGVLQVGGSSERGLDGLDMPFLQILADLIAMAVGRQRPIETHATPAKQIERAAILSEAKLAMLETHHRVRNSLQLVQSLLLMQGRATQDKQASTELLESAARIRTVASIHHRLYGLGSSSSIMEVATYLKELVEDLRSGIVSTAEYRRIDLAADPVAWPIEDISTLGLVLTELVTNALKHGTGVITVTFRQPTGGNGVLTVCDQGQLPADFDPARSHGFGMRLIRTLLQDKDASLEIDRDRGCSCFICHMPPTRVIEAAETLLPEGDQS